MAGAIAVYVFLYAGAAVFLAGCIVRILQYSRLPVHLRWELYPVPEGFSGQLKIMIPEILLLKALREENPRLWRRSYPFHLGLYLLAVTAALTVAAALIPGLYAVGRITGYAGVALTLIGSLALLARRLWDRELRPFSTPGDVFNLVWFAATAALLLAGLLTPRTASVLDVVRGAFTFDTGLRPPATLAAGLISASALLAYIPMTHMAHFIAKYFTFHAVRWDERPNKPGGSMEKRVTGYLGYRPTWSARHVGADGSRTWADIATSNPAKGAPK